MGSSAQNFLLILLLEGREGEIERACRCFVILKEDEEGRMEDVREERGSSV